MIELHIKKPIHAIGLDIDEYHKIPNFSSSDINCFYQSGNTMLDFRSHYEYRLKGNKDRKPSESLILGQMTHLLLLEPDKIGPYGESITANFKIRKKTVDRLLEKATNMTKELRQNRQCAHLLSQVDPLLEVENSFVWWNDALGAGLKSRPDAFHGNIILEIKTTKKGNASPNLWKKVIRTMGYHRQAALIIDGMEQFFGAQDYYFIFLVVENEFPFNHAVYQLNNNDIQLGRREYYEAVVSILQDYPNPNIRSYLDESCDEIMLISSAEEY